MTTQCSTGRLTDTPYVLNDLTDSSTGRVRETIVLPNYETDSSTGRIRETPRPTNDQTHSTTGRVRERNSPPAKRSDRFQHVASKANCPPAELRDRIHHGACQRNSSDVLVGRVRETPNPTIRFQHGRVREIPHLMNNPTVRHRAFKRHSLRTERLDRVLRGACKRDYRSTELRDRFQHRA